MPLTRLFSHALLFTCALISCGDDDGAECASPYVLTATGCELRDAAAEDAEHPGSDAGSDGAAGDVAANTLGRDAGSDAGPVETCNGLDDDGDGETDEGLTEETFFRDSDNDSFGAADDTCMACGAAECGAGEWVTNNMDCDDACDRCFPGGSEVCDERNNDCDELVDEGVSRRYFEDLDRDGFGSQVFVDACSIPDGFAVDGGDCADMEPRAHPGSMTYRAEPMGNPPASGLAFDYDCDGVETYEILLEGRPGDVCSRPSCPDIDRWETRPPCGEHGSVFRCFSIATSCRALESSQELALCR